MTKSLEREAKAKKDAKLAKQKLASQTKRVEAGVCIHCNRTFQQLARHMKCKHDSKLMHRPEEAGA